MNLQIKLLEREPFIIQVTPEESLANIKNLLYEQYLRIPINEQRLIYRGRILQDNKSLVDYPEINNNSKLHLIMVTKKKHPLYKRVHEILRPHYSEEDTQKILSIFMRQRVYELFRQLSLDDLERIAHEVLTDKSADKLEKMIVDEEVNQGL